jgi:hypothetical protein
MNFPRFSSQCHPIFVLGILQRSGTNYLNNLLLLHPDVKPPGIVWEDFFLRNAQHLAAYVESTESHWTATWKEGVALKLGGGALAMHLGAGLVQFMERQCQESCKDIGRHAEGKAITKLVTATPSVKNLAMFFALFPTGVPLIIVRDGRALVESGVRSFGWDYEEAMRMWVDGARSIREFSAATGNAGKYMLVRYENLYSRNREVMMAILKFVNLDPGRFDFDLAADLAVMGSSDVARNGGSVSWKNQEKRPDFDPLGRASRWSTPMRCRFNWIAAREMRALGYDVEAVPIRANWNRVMDRLYGLEVRLKWSPRIAALLRRWRLSMMQVPR